MSKYGRHVPSSDGEANVSVSAADPPMVAASAGRAAAEEDGSEVGGMACSACASYRAAPRSRTGGSYLPPPGLWLTLEFFDGADQLIRANALGIVLDW